MQVNFWCLSVIIENDTKPPRQERKIKMSIDHPETLFRWQTTVTFMEDSGNICTKHTQTHLIPGIDVAHRNVHQCCQSTPSNVWNSILFNAIYSINQQIKRNTGSKKHIGLTHLLPLFCRSLSQFHLHVANRVWLRRNTSLSARLD